MDHAMLKIEVICGELKKLVEEKIPDTQPTRFIKSDYKTGNTPPSFEEGWKEYRGEFFQEYDGHYWFYKKFRTMPAQEGKEIILKCSTDVGDDWAAKNPQCILYLNGKMAQGFDLNHTEHVLDPDTEYEMYLYLYTGMREDAVFVFDAHVSLLDKRIEKLYYDLKVPLDCCAVLKEKNNQIYLKTLNCLEQAVGYLDMRVPKSEAFYKSVAYALNYLDREYYHGICGKETVGTVTCIGHTHIDVAWLWTLAQTREKTQRSFSTVLAMMKQYPEYLFMSSQPQLYQYLKQEAPEVYEQVKQAVKEGRWEVEGAMWLEADCNISSGESLVRQILFGKRFMKTEFGVDSQVLWLPDVFGYSAALPQILKKSGVTRFVTSKISWNDTNKMPVDTFLWEGIDGTKVFTHFMTALEQGGGLEKFATTYNGYIKPKQVYETYEPYQQKEYSDEVLLTYGYGDGGGGPTKDMLEQQRRLAYGIPGMPKTHMDKAGNFLERLEQNFRQKAEQLKRTPKWAGELYLEYHRGTYTSLAKNKRNNRKSELLYQTLEGLSVLDSLLLGKGYPQKAINDNWERILLNQFHDILPGSSIHEVYEECDRQYAGILGQGQELLNSALSDIAQNIGTEGGVMVYNPHSYTWSDCISYQGKQVYVEDVPAFGWKVVHPKAKTSTVSVSKNEMENQFYRIKLDNNANILSIYDKSYDREVLDGAGNILEAYEDLPPQYYDAWELSSYYKDKLYRIDSAEKIEVLEEGARAGLAVTRKFLDSTIIQKIYLYENSRRIDFETSADWHQQHIVLKAAFPLNIHTNRATYDIQFGSVERPNHQNTSWDKAKFEVCAQKWADLSEGNYGVSLLNDCKYGHNADGNVLKLTLLKCPVFPDHSADQGQHTFTYALYPHKGGTKHTVREAYALNLPFLSLDTGNHPHGMLPEQYSLLSCEQDNIIIETVKKAEDSDDFIIRLYETQNCRGEIKVQFGFDMQKLYLCDLMENELSEIPANGRSASFPVKPFEIVTLKICR